MKIQEYLSSLEDPVDIDQLGVSFSGLTDEYKDAIKQFHEEKKGIILEINSANDEYAELVKNNFREQKKKLEMQNEIEALNNLIDNNNKLKNDIESVNNKFSENLASQGQNILEKINSNAEELKNQEKEFGNF